MSRNTRKNVMRRVRKWEKSVNEFVIHIQHTHMNKEFSHLIFGQTTKTIACGRVSEQARAQAMRSSARQPGKIMTIFPFIYYLINLSSIFSPSIRFCLLFRFLCFFCCASSIYKIFQLAWNMWTNFVFSLYHPNERFADIIHIYYLARVLSFIHMFYPPVQSNFRYINYYVYRTREISLYFRWFSLCFGWFCCCWQNTYK